ncbi:hypothetical protein OSB04_010130 [Centaurea solstitialis]|uniref:Leucine-rich repeat-containing N-terminal plant-type domain-containing protein n=1 Tax=Centaurea solstitialis TaxID=347529 RepID=A0AA38WP14_9ASTR|nr:hypothetical protein OSB04_010130 [Centaurea solstitialis]
MAVVMLLKCAISDEWRWSAVGEGGRRWSVVARGSRWWSAVARGGRRWSVVARGGRRWSAVARGGGRWSAVVGDGRRLLEAVGDMIWFYFTIIILLPFPNTTTLATSTGNQLGAIASARGGGDAVNKSCFHKERHALLHFKANLEDPGGRLSRWRVEDEDCCKWSGVTCNNQTHHVTVLDLSLYFLGGEISPSLLNLSYLNHLDLNRNNFNGTIPTFIASMTQLRYLDLSINKFHGTIPKFIGSLTQLRYLDLSYNNLVGSIPPAFGNLTSLRNFSLQTYVGYPPIEFEIENLDWLSNLSHLQYLNLWGSSLAKANHWVDAILSLPKLSYLNLEECRLSEVMHPYSSFVNSPSSSIQYLSLGYNNLNSSMYHWLFPLTSNRLLELHLSGNMLDWIPKYLGNLCSLTSLSFDRNSVHVHLPKFLNNLSGCTSYTLLELEAGYNQFTGPLSDEIQKFSSLQSLTLSHNHLSGSMSEKVWELSNLETLDVSSNSLIISPNNIGKSKLRHIDLSNNSLVVTPVEFWNTWPLQLTYLHISSNNINGEVSDLSSNFGHYSSIDLSSNNFYGPISMVPPTLVSLNLSKNKFYGGISFICQVVDDSLSLLDLSHNSFTGQLPDCLWNFKELRVLNLGDNNIFGRLPASIGNLVQLEALDLYKNNFSGELPLALKNCKKLQFLNLGDNKFFGNVPIWVGESLSSLYGLSLRSNNFFGSIPIQLCHLVNLQILDLSINNLNGTIPSCLNNLSVVVPGIIPVLEPNKHTYGMQDKDDKNLYIQYGSYADNAIINWHGNEQEFTSNLGLLMSIDLSSNNLTGQIPNELTDLHELLALNLSKNELLGEIPGKIGEMKKLLTLDLSRNNFSGRMPSSMSEMTSLDWLDVSYNNLSGRIPSSTQLQSFQPSKYTGNARLCGPPLTKSCPGDKVPSVASKSESGEEGTDELERWFYIGGGTGFATGFWIACVALLVNRRGRHVFFPFVDSVKDWVYVKVMLFIRKLRRVQHA